MAVAAMTSSSLAMTEAWSRFRFAKWPLKVELVGDEVACAKTWSHCRSWSGTFLSDKCFDPAVNAR